MAVRFILGRAGTGKTTEIMQQITERMKQQRDGTPLIYLVPEQATFQVERRLAAMPGLGGLIRAQVLSFRRLAYRILQEAGGMAKLPIDELGKQMVLRMLLEKHGEHLQLFHRAAQKPGFAEQLARMISECKRYGVTPEMLAEREWKNSTLSQKMGDLSLLMREYDRYMDGVYYDTDDMLGRVAEKIAASEYLREAEIWLDGFSGFTKQEYLLIGQLMRCAREVTIALCLDPAEREQPVDPLHVFYPTQDTYQRLLELAREASVEVGQPILLEQAHRFAASPQLAHLERTYFSLQPPGHAPAASREGEVELVTAVNRRAEVQALALRILALVRDQGYRWRELGVLLRDIGIYADEIASVFTDYEIPFFLDQKRSVLHHPLIELVRSALEVVTKKWGYEAVFRCLKTDLIAPPGAESAADARSEVDLLENYVLAYGIYGSQWSSEQPWSFHSERETAFAGIDSIRRRYAQPLLAFERAVKQAEGENVRAMTAALYQFVADLQVEDKLAEWQGQAEAAGDLEAAREHAQVWNQFVDLLDQVVEAMGQLKLDLVTYSRILDSGLESIRLGLVPPSLDQVVIGQMERSRHANVKVLFLLGVNEGIIPQRPSEEGILDEAEREQAAETGIELAPGARERLMAEQYLLYRALTRPSERLWASCALADDEGKALLPSSAFQRIRQALPDVTIRLFTNQPSGLASSDADLVGRPRQLFSHLLSLLRQMKQGTPLTPFWWEVYDWFARRGKPESEEHRQVAGLMYDNQVRKLPPELSRDLYGKSLRMSVSRLERFQACPFSHFASHGLRLAERQLYKLERFDVGELFHASLKRAVEEMNERGLDWGKLSERDSFTLASDVVDELVPKTRSSILSRTARYRFVTGTLKRAVGRALAVLGEHARRSRFVPVGLEVAFGPGGELPGLALELENGVTLQLIGRIDRVDQSAEAGQRYLRVIDYKSGPKSLSLSDVWNGLNLQLLVYLDVVAANAKEWLGEECEVGGVFYYQVADPFISAKRMLSPEEAAKQRAGKLKMKGLMRADRELVRLMDDQLESGWSDLLPVGLKNDGTFRSQSAVATAEEFAGLQRHVRNTVKQLSQRMVEGEIAIAPYVQGTFSACQMCAYKPVCQFDPLHEGNRQRMIGKLPNREVMQLIMQETVQRQGEGGSAHGDEGGQA
ncbi:helicase-exonuclease AddAB subunit AddB [Brevibacillus massiliensis]|jgi:ATP-dependent helicase/nuclease subunit B|uniref:helicase-exonuclease AddAB subunit AddB n=1 Tax=Brevibacillus massiliensis TaxID=1118054 RepID=UPI0002F2EE7A|nr:helicase-exonuclease AddAB subunit AddB [Brevibacillus massiliensis]